MSYDYQIIYRQGKETVAVEGHSRVCAMRGSTSKHGIECLTLSSFGLHQRL